jgi:hypothetical protein
MEEINIQERDGLQPDPISDKTKVELALIDLYNRLAMQIPANHQQILDELAEKLLPQEASLTVKQVAGSLDASSRDEFYEKELKRYNVGTRVWPPSLTKNEQDYMYEWIRKHSGK